MQAGPALAGVKLEAAEAEWLRARDDWCGTMLALVAGPGETPRAGLLDVLARVERAIRDANQPEEWLNVHTSRSPTACSSRSCGTR